MAADADTPLFVVWTGGLDKADGLEIYDRADVPVFENPARCIRTIAAVSQFDAARDRLENAKSLPARPPTPNDGDHDDAPAVLSETDAKSILNEYGISIPDERLVTSADEAGDAADQIGYPVVAKLISPDVQHRNQIDGVRLDLESRRAVETAFEEIDAISPSGTSKSLVYRSSNKSLPGSSSVWELSPIPTSARLSCSVAAGSTSRRSMTSPSERSP